MITNSYQNILKGLKMEQKYDSRPETYKHIGEVRKRMNACIKDLIRRAEVHDASKIESPEVEVFDQYTPMLAGITYGSQEYKECLDKMRPAIDHHQKNNSHHPEFYTNGIQGMSLLDLLEMVCDWKAATLRHNDGDIRRSIEINQKRFGYSDELKQILLNTLPLVESV